MISLVSDENIVGETETTLFTMLQQSPMDALVVMKNSGVNTMNFRWEYLVGSTWTNLGASGTDYYNTLTAGQVRTMKVESSATQVRLRGNASGGAYLEFSVTRYLERASGGYVPVLSL